MKILLFSLLLGLSNFALASECKLPTKPTIISQEAHELHQFWIFEEDSVFTSNVMPDAPELIKYLSEIKSRIPDWKVYYSTNDRPGGKMNSQVVNLLQADLTQGWILSNHLHNHNFNMPVINGIVLVGGPSPSLSDVALYRDFYRSLGLKSASVTNGFDTLYIDSSEFSIFHAR